MTWQSRNTRAQLFIRMAVSVVVTVFFGRTAMPIESSSNLPLERQTDREIKRQNAAFLSKDREWDLTGITTIDEQNLWVVGNAVNWRSDGKSNAESAVQSVLNPSNGIVLCSTDAGQSWAIRRVEPGKYFSGVHFVDRMTGWVSDASNLILKTTDAGHTWAAQLAPAMSYWCHVQFVDSRRGWILGADGKVLRTEDGGRKWKLSRIATTGDLFFLGFADANNGWIVGQKGAAYETTDSGTHWRSRGDELLRLLTNWADSEISFRTVKFVNSKIGFIAADILSKSASFNAQAVVFKTVDRGRTWTPSIIPEALGIRNAEFLNEMEAWLVPEGSGNSSLLHTRNGGANWSAIRLPRNGEPSRVSFVDSKHGWFLNMTDNFSSDQIFTTKDGGRTWVEIKISERIIP